MAASDARHPNILAAAFQLSQGYRFPPGGVREIDQHDIRLPIGARVGRNDLPDHVGSVPAAVPHTGRNSGLPFPTSEQLDRLLARYERSSLRMLPQNRAREVPKKPNGEGLGRLADVRVEIA
jgi:hypothetical protein